MRGEQVLLVRQTPSHPLGAVWTIPWGVLESGEAPASAAVREAREEAGIRAEVSGLVAVQSLPEPWAGTIALVFLCRHISGTPTPDGVETDAARYMVAADIGAERGAFEPWSRWLVERVFAGHTRALQPVEGNPFGMDGCIATPAAADSSRASSAARGELQLLVNIDVDDMDRAERFYTEAFGVRVGRRFGATGVELTGASSRIYLLAKAAGSKPADAAVDPRTYRRHWTPVHFDIVVDDIDAAVHRAVAAGALLERPVQASAWGKLALLSDPFGHGFCLVQFLGRGYDEIAV
jgi:ADP-ribose pyrophosphatase YjhB (NUDIX family)/predicted enzyme related to lactoylglutathione lyase